MGNWSFFSVLDTFAAFVTALCSGMGIGGGGLLTVYLSLVRNAEHLTTQGINLLCFLCSAVASLACPPPKENFSLPKKTVFAMGAAGAVFALAGSLCSAYLPDRIFRDLFGIFLCAVGVKGLIQKQEDPS